MRCVWSGTTVSMRRTKYLRASVFLQRYRKVLPRSIQIQPPPLETAWTWTWGWAQTSLLAAVIQAQPRQASVRLMPMSLWHFTCLRKTRSLTCIVVAHIHRHSYSSCSASSSGLDGLAGPMHGLVSCQWRHRRFGRLLVLRRPNICTCCWNVPHGGTHPPLQRTRTILHRRCILSPFPTFALAVPWRQLCWTCMPSWPRPQAHSP